MMRALLLGLALLCGGACSGAEPELRELRVYAAASLQEVMQSAGDRFAQDAECRVRYHFAGTNELARQLLAGAQADVLFSANEAEMDRLEEAGLRESTTRASFVSNRMVLLETAQPVRRGDAVRFLALADEAVPAGKYARAWLAGRDELSALLNESRVISTIDVRAALAAVESGGADLACVYATDARLGEGVQVRAEQDPQEGPRIVYPVASLRTSAQPELARAFVSFLAEQADLFEQYGFLVKR